MSKFNNNSDLLESVQASQQTPELLEVPDGSLRNQMEIRSICMILAGALGSTLLRPGMAVHKLIVEDDKIHLYTQSNKLIITLNPGNNTVDGMKVRMEIEI
jgi:hypothetical protein